MKLTSFTSFVHRFRRVQKNKLRFCGSTHRFRPELLEDRLVLSVSVGDDGGDRDIADYESFGIHALAPPAFDVSAYVKVADVGRFAPTAALSETFSLHSNPGADHTIYLDFDGHVTSNTPYNSYFADGAAISTSAYDFDGNLISFSDTELARIQAIWQRVTEDFIPFDVNVTTQAPSLDALTNGGGDDVDWGVRVVIGGSSGDWYGSSAGGVGYMNAFTSSSDIPVFVFEDNLGNGHEKYTAEAISHEAGHALGLSHDGKPGVDYYRGHGSGDTGWAPILGSGYYKNLTQWSRGEYAGANNSQDDLAIITSVNGFGYRADDYGDDSGSATPLEVSGTSVSGTGIIETNTDVDVFSFVTDAGTVQLDIAPFARAPNLDVRAELYDASDNLIVTDNPASHLDASLNATVSSGIYYLHITGTGEGDPLNGGYTDYASLGQYFISGSILPSNDEFISISATKSIQFEGDSGSTDFDFSVIRTGDTSGTTTVNFMVNGSSAAPADAADFVGGVMPGGSVTFAAGEDSKTITIAVAGDVEIEPHEGLTVTLSNPSGTAKLGTSQANATIRNDDASAMPGISVSPTSGLTTKETGTIAKFSVTLDSRPTASVSIPIRSLDTSEGTVDKSRLTFTSDNWDQIQTVTVRGVDDTVRDGHVSYMVQLGAAESSDSNYNGLDPADVPMTNLDNDKTSNAKGKGNGKPKKRLALFHAGTSATVDSNDFSAVVPSSVTYDFVFASGDVSVRNSGRSEEPGSRNAASDTDALAVAEILGFAKGRGPHQSVSELHAERDLLVPLSGRLIDTALARLGNTFAIR